MILKDSLDRDSANKNDIVLNKNQRRLSLRRRSNRARTLDDSVTAKEKSTSGGPDSSQNSRRDKSKINIDPLLQETLYTQSKQWDIHLMTHDNDRSPCELIQVNQRYYYL